MKEKIKIGVVCLARNTYDVEAAIQLYKNTQKELNEKKEYHWIIEKEVIIEDEDAIKSALKFKAEQLLDLLKDLKEFSIEVEENFSIVGGGSMPKTKLKTYVLDLKHDRFSPEDLEVKLRNSKIPIIVRLEKNSIKLDVRTIEEDEFKYILESLVELRCY